MICGVGTYMRDAKEKEEVSQEARLRLKIVAHTTKVSGTYIARDKERSPLGKSSSLLIDRYDKPTAPHPVPIGRNYMSCALVEIIETSAPGSL